MRNIRWTACDERAHDRWVRQQESRSFRTIPSGGADIPEYSPISLEEMAHTLGFDSVEELWAHTRRGSPGGWNNVTETRNPPWGRWAVWENPAETHRWRLELFHTKEEAERFAKVRQTAR